MVVVVVLVAVIGGAVVVVVVVGARVVSGASETVVVVPLEVVHATRTSAIALYEMRISVETIPTPIFGVTLTVLEASSGGSVR